MTSIFPPLALSFLSKQKVASLEKFPFFQDYSLGKIGPGKLGEDLSLFKEDLSKSGFTPSELQTLEILLHYLEERDSPSLESSKLLCKLAEKRSPPLIPLLVLLSNDPRVQVRNLAISSLNKLGPSIVQGPIKELSESQDPLIRKMGLFTLSVLYGNIRNLPLYQGQHPSFFEKGRFKRAEFGKSGSRTILLGGNLAGKAIIRIVSRSALEAWIKALDSKEYWKGIGFDYVPIEPIAEKNGRRMVIAEGEERFKVVSKVIGMNLFEFLSVPKNKKFENFLKDEYEKILLGLIRLGIDHGHPHFGNFCVEETPNGPRLYAIDFDEALLIPSKDKK